MRPKQVSTEQAIGKTIAKIKIVADNDSTLAISFTDDTYMLFERSSWPGESDTYVSERQWGSAEIEFDLGLISAVERDRLLEIEAERRRACTEERELQEYRKLHAKYSSR